ncbi:hypothetical protein DL98DRAFT_542439 [Cadophora sp. DSE1049]|nr:hypothetical protein DL98DRAFT_542439 [Cadophora sp. DSE1049]
MSIRRRPSIIEINTDKRTRRRKAGQRREERYDFMEKQDLLLVFFPRGPGAQYFEVQASESCPAIPSGDIDLGAIKKELGQAIQQAEEEERRQIIEPEEAREPNS